MSGWTVPPSAAIPPGVGLSPPPAVGLAYQPEAQRPEEEEQLMRQSEWAEHDAADRHQTGDGPDHKDDEHRTRAELEHEVEATRERVNDSVVELRERLGIGLDDLREYGPFAPVRRHPLTVAFAAAGMATAAVVGVSLARAHRKSSGRIVAVRDSASGNARRVAKDALKASRRRRKAARKRLNSAKDAFGSAADAVRSERRKVMRRLTRH
ncbi:hypothetical protein [Glycomyces sp. NRRL B-16210]|uniref:hypothetical protein n=1 Tax=Glycomyces sp. NRRL B-16210 TaxID=1463821 RepID=UPI0004C24BA5|nr:hypothetical protein [Glycomyces sp. NRRL B-16210]